VTVIKFPGGGRPPPPEMKEIHLGEAIETAAEIHDLIIEGLRCPCFAENSAGLKAVMPAALSDLFGPEYVDWAETQFDLIYGVDPYTFIDHLAAYREND